MPRILVIARLAVLLISGILVSPCGPTRANELQIRNMFKSTGELSMGALITKQGGCVILLGAFLSAGEFFPNLKIEETPSGIEYRHASVQITRFPRNLQINVVIQVWKCEQPETADPDAIKILLESFQWTAGWKTGLKIRSPEKIETTLEQGSPDEIENRIGLEPPPGPIWNVTIKLQDQDAPLSDSLILTASTQSGSIIGRFSGHLILDPAHRETKVSSKASTT